MNRTVFMSWHCLTIDRHACRGGTKDVGAISAKPIRSLRDGQPAGQIRAHGLRNHLHNGVWTGSLLIVLSKEALTNASTRECKPKTFEPDSLTFVVHAGSTQTHRLNMHDRRLAIGLDEFFQSMQNRCRCAANAHLTREEVNCS